MKLFYTTAAVLAALMAPVKATSTTQTDITTTTPTVEPHCDPSFCEVCFSHCGHPPYDHEWCDKNAPPYIVCHVDPMCRICAAVCLLNEEGTCPDGACPYVPDHDCQATDTTGPTETDTTTTGTGLTTTTETESSTSGTGTTTLPGAGTTETTTKTSADTETTTMSASDGCDSDLIDKFIEIEEDPQEAFSDTSIIVGNTGSNEAVNNMQPYQVLNYVIALQGTFPPRNRRALEEEEGVPQYVEDGDQKHRRLGSDPFLGQISIVGFNFDPRAWARCDGQLLPIAQNTALFSLLGTTYGGDGRTNFALPDLRGRVPIHNGEGFNVGARGGAETNTLTVSDLPSHTHDATESLSRITGLVEEVFEPGSTTTSTTLAEAVSTTRTTAGGTVATTCITDIEDKIIEITAADPLDLSAFSDIGVTVGNKGGGQPHTNMQPFLAVNYIIALDGVFPSRNRRGLLEEAGEPIEEVDQGRRRLSSEPFLGQIAMFGGNYAPRGWALCNGQLLPVTQNTALFSLLGTTYGGDGRTTFGLPDLRERAPMHPGAGPGLTPRSLGQKAGSEEVKLGGNHIPSHSHTAEGSHTMLTGVVTAVEPSVTTTVASTTATTTGAGGGITDLVGKFMRIVDSYPGGFLSTFSDIDVTLENTGGGQSHSNIQPFQAVHYIIALQGTFPSRNRRGLEEEERFVENGQGRRRLFADPFVGEIVMFAGDFAPRGWAFCDGQLLQVSQNNVLFSLLGTMYGGDGRTTFGLPDLRGRVPIHYGQGSGLSNRRMGEKAGSETNTLAVNQMPIHDHTATGTLTRVSGVVTNVTDGIMTTSAGGTGTLPPGIQTIPTTTVTTTETDTLPPGVLTIPNTTTTTTETETLPPGVYTIPTTTVSTVGTIQYQQYQQQQRLPRRQKRRRQKKRPQKSN